MACNLERSTTSLITAGICPSSSIPTLVRLSPFPTNPLASGKVQRGEVKTWPPPRRRDGAPPPPAGRPPPHPHPTPPGGGRKVGAKRSPRDKGGKEHPPPCPHPPRGD